MYDDRFNIYSVNTNIPAVLYTSNRKGINPNKS